MNFINFMDKKYLLDKLCELAEANNGKPLGREAFYNATGITYASIIGPKFGWRSWNDFVQEAGLATSNSLQVAIPIEQLLDHLVDLTEELDRFPVSVDLRIKRASDKTFPSHGVFDKLGDIRNKLEQVRDRALARDMRHIVEICEARLLNIPIKSNTCNQNSDKLVAGSIYLFKSGQYYKIGKTNELSRRKRELSIQMPEPLFLIHEIKTDDISGIEIYWHNRFAPKRMNGEWFDLSDNDVKAFRKRKFM